VISIKIPSRRRGGKRYSVFSKKEKVELLEKKRSDRPRRKLLFYFRG